MSLRGLGFDRSGDASRSSRWSVDPRAASPALHVDCSTGLGSRFHRSRLRVAPLAYAISTPTARSWQEPLGVFFREYGVSDVTRGKPALCPQLLYTEST